MKKKSPSEEKGLRKLIEDVYIYGSSAPEKPAETPSEKGEVF